jgi:cytoskeleton protein RodZ
MINPDADPLSQREASTSTEEEPHPQVDTPGAQLLAARRNQGLSLGDIARQLKLSVRQIEALERDDYARFAGSVFVRGFLRNYAKLLHLDPEPLLAAASPAVTPVAVEATMAGYIPVSAANPERRRRFLAWGAVIVLAVLVVFLLAANVSKEHHETPAPDAAQVPSSPVGTPQHVDSPPSAMSQNLAPPVVANPAPSVPAVAAPVEPSRAAGPKAALITTPVAAVPKPPEPRGPESMRRDSPAAPQTAAVSKPRILITGSGTSQIRMNFEDESWVEVKDGSGATIFSRLNTPGTERVIKGAAPLTVVVGNAHGVKLLYQDKAVDLGPHTRVDVARVTLE